MTAVHAFLDRVAVLAKTAVTYLVIASGIVTTILATVDIPVVTQWGGVALTWIAAAISIIRRVTPVPAEERGLVA
jgi:hypothetical protein